MKQNNGYKNSGIEWLGDVPEHWKVQRIKDVVEFNPSTKSEKISADELVTILPMNCISEDGKILEEIFQPFNETDKGLTYFRNGDVIFAKITPCMENGKGAFIDSLKTQFALGSTEFFVLRPSTKIDGKFLFYFTWNTEYRKLAVLSMRGAAGQQRVPSEFIKQSRISFPPRTEQTTIANYLDKSIVDIDGVIKIKNEQLSILENYKRSVIHETVTKGLNKSADLVESNIDWIGKYPKHWKVERLKFVLDKIGSGVTPKGGASVYQDSGVPLIRSQNVLNDRLDFSDIAFISEKIHADMANSKVQSGDVLLNITGASIGRCYYYDSTAEANVNQHVCILRPNSKIQTHFLYHLLISEIGQSQIYQGFTGSSREGLNFEEIKSFYIPLPPTNEQSILTKRLDLILVQVNREKEAIEVQIEKLKEYRNALIHECVTGKRNVYGG